MKRFLLVICTVFLCSGICQGQTLKFGVVDVDKVLKGYSGMKSTMQSLQDLYSQEQLKLDEMSEKIRELNRDIKEKADLMPEDVLQNKQKQLRELKAEYYAYGSEKEDVLGERKNRELDRIIEKIQTAVTKLAQEEKLNFVLKASALAYHDGSLDITEKVIQKLNEEPAEAPEKTGESKPN